MMNLENKLILAIETAIGGGSISVSNGENEIDFWIGTDDISKAEDVLENIEILLKKNRIKKTGINLIAVSTEAGSSTGLKIGSAIAKGLAKGLNCPVKEISFWEAVSIFNETDSLNKKFYLPSGRGGICCRNWNSEGFESQVEVFTQEKFYSNIEDFADSHLYIHGKLFDNGKLKSLETKTQITNLGRNLARLIGKFASDNQISCFR